MADDWDVTPESKDDWPEPETAGNGNRPKIQVLQVSKVKAIVKKTSGKRTSREFIELLDNMVVIAIEKLAGIHDGGAKTLSGKLLSVYPLRATAQGLERDKVLDKRKKFVRRKKT
jgi:hypothetical protein